MRLASGSVRRVGEIVPDALGTMLQRPDPSKAPRVMEAMIKLVKLVIARLERAYRGE
jgi:hypothetical protein